MNTVFFLMAEFNSASIPLADIAERYLGMKPSTAEKKASLGDLPIPTFRIGESQKAPRLVHIQDLADHIDKQRKLGQELLDIMANRRAN